MSAWLCKKGTLSLVADTIKSDDFKEYDTENYSEKETSELMEILSDLNTKSLNARYGESQNHILKDKTYIKLDTDECQRHKSVCCYLYQTAESSECTTHPLFKALEKWSDDTEDKYDNGYWWDCKWDIDKTLKEL